jgi:DNA-cytosine methyltransferase
VKQKGVKEFNVLSLFDGMSCGQIALERAGIKVNKYYASEIDKHAIKVTQHNYPNTIQIGNVVDVDVTKLEPIDLLIGGSPCQSFSFVGKRNGMTTSCNEEIYTLERYLELKAEGFEFEGESYLFWEYMRILTDIRKYNPDVLFLLENVEMGAKWERVLSEAIGIYGVHINSALVSAQNRKRIYWTNIRVKKVGLFRELHSDIPQPEDRGILLKDILEDEVDEKYYLSDKMLNYFNGNSKKMKDAGNGFSFSPTIGDKKAKAVTTKCGGRMDDEYIIVIPEETAKGCVEKKTGECFDAENVNSKTRRGRKMVNKSNCLMAKKTDFMHYSQNARIRRLTPIECERLQTVDDNYTACVSDTQRYKMLGNGWTVEVIAHIFSFIK